MGSANGRKEGFLSDNTLTIFQDGAGDLLIGDLEYSGMGSCWQISAPASFGGTASDFVALFSRQLLCPRLASLRCAERRKNPSAFAWTWLFHDSLPSDDAC
jgi:hypothetical protein